MKLESKTTKQIAEDDYLEGKDNKEWTSNDSLRKFIEDNKWHPQNFNQYYFSVDLLLKELEGKQ